MLLGDARCAFMDQQIAHCYVSIAQVGAEKRFAEIFHELVTCRVTADKLAALMSWAVEGAVSLVYIINQRAEERWS